MFKAIGRAVLLATGLWSAPAIAQDLPEIRLALLKFGTVNWEAQTIVNHGLDEKHGFSLEIVPFAGGDATRVAILSGNVDVTTGDWLFASRQRAEGTPLTFVPYSTSIGALMAPCDGNYQSLADLKGKLIGVAGGPLDKSWLMLQGMAQSRYGFDLASETDQLFGAPPLLAEKLRQGELDATLNYWHFNARLTAEGYCTVVTAQEAAHELGAKSDLSAIGYIFNEDWADANPELAIGFVKASRDAKTLLETDDTAWTDVRPIMRAENQRVFETLVKDWRAGIPKGSVAEEERDTAAVYAYLAKAVGAKLVGTADEMAQGTFWPALMNGD